MEDKLTVRDQLAMSMPVEGMPKIENDAAGELIAERYGLEWDSTDTMKMYIFSMKYHAAVRYEYADAMLAYRG